MGKKGWVALWLTGLLLLGQAEQLPAVPADGTAALSQQRYVALTFDDGPKRETTARLLDGLRERGASATFFLIGRQIPDQRDLVERMKAEGHQVGNHTWNHIRLATTSDPAVAAQEIQKTDTLLREILGDGTYWLRPPYGAIQEAQKPQIPVPMVTWTVDSRDWESLNAKTVVQSVLRDVKPNSIILMHDIHPTTVEALKKVLPWLVKNDYDILTVSELAKRKGAVMHDGKAYGGFTGN